MSLTRPILRGGTKASKPHSENAITGKATCHHYWFGGGGAGGGVVCFLGVVVVDVDLSWCDGCVQQKNADRNSEGGQF